MTFIAALIVGAFAGIGIHSLAAFVSEDESEGYWIVLVLGNLLVIPCLLRLAGVW